MCINSLEQSIFYGEANSMNELHIPYKPSLQQQTIEHVAQQLAHEPVSGHINSVNWRETYPAKPQVSFTTAHTGEMLYVQFHVQGEGLRAVHTHDLEHVHEDSCVEIFIANEDNTRYWNIEFNCIGVCNASDRISKTEDVHNLSDTALQSISRYSSLNTEPFDNRQGLFSWTLTIGVPLSILHITPDMLHRPVIRQGNLYKCGDLTPQPHYLSWNPISAPKPNFHLPAFFGTLILESIGQIQYTNSTTPISANHGNEGVVKHHIINSKFHML